MLMEVKFVIYANAAVSIVVTLDGMLTEVKFVTPLNALYTIVVTVDGIVNAVDVSAGE
jgi:hypothetical protein